MFGTDMLSFQEFVMKEPLPLATIQNEILAFLQDRDDAVVFGAIAVNAYVAEPRMTQDIDLLSPRAEMLAEELRAYLREKLHVSIRIRQVDNGHGFRLYQVRKSGNRHLADVRAVENLPTARTVERVLILAPVELIASKVVSYYRRRGQPKSGTDWRDLALLLLKFPELKASSGAVADSLLASGADPAILSTWQEIVVTEIQPEREDYGY